MKHACDDIEIRDARDNLRHRRSDAIRNAKVERERRTYSPVVLCVATVLLPAPSDDGAVQLVLAVAAVRVTKQKAGDWRAVRARDACAGICDGRGESGAGGEGGEVLGEGHLTVEVRLAQAVVLHRPEVEAEDHSVLALHD